MNSNIDVKIGRRGFLKDVAAATGAVPLDAADGRAIFAE
jgi:hypothetical protein